MPKFPEPPPPERLAAIGAETHTLPRGAELWRVYFRATAHPGAWDAFRTWGPVATVRFDHHLPPPRAQDRGILYAAHGAHGFRTALAEVFQRRRQIDPFFGEPWLVGFALTGDIALLDLTGLWPTRAGASSALNSGPRARARRWSAAIYDAFPAVQGLWYPSSLGGNTPAVALYERARGVIPDHPTFHAPLAHPALALPLRHAAHDLGYSLLRPPRG